MSCLLFWSTTLFQVRHDRISISVFFLFSFPSHFVMSCHESKKHADDVVPGEKPSNLLMNFLAKKDWGPRKEGKKRVTMIISVIIMYFTCEQLYKAGDEKTKEPFHAQHHFFEFFSLVIDNHLIIHFFKPEKLSTLIWKLRKVWTVWSA